MNRLDWLILIYEILTKIVESMGTKVKTLVSSRD